MDDYFEKILQADVYEVAKKTPLEKAHNLSNTLNNEVFLKREDLQDVFSFKIRGAYNKMSKLTNSQLAQGVITSSAGNHAQGVALSALKLNCQATILKPITTPIVKVNAVKNLKAKVILFGDNYDETYKEAIRISQERNLCFILPFDDPDVIAGQGTIAIELEQQLKEKPYAIYIAVGGGGLISGISLYIKNIWPEVKIIGVEPEDADAMTKSLEEDKIVELSSVGQFADGVAVKKIGKNTFDIGKKYIDNKKNRIKKIIEIKSNNKKYKFKINKDLYNYKLNLAAAIAVISNFIKIDKLNKNIFKDYIHPSGRGNLKKN